MKLGTAPFRLTWEALHGPCVEGISFEDTQLRGPFRRWHHVHRFEDTASGSALIDIVDWEAPLGCLGRFFGGWKIRRELARLFHFRHVRTRLDLEHQLVYKESAMSAPLRIAVTGASGFVGRALIPYLTTAGHEVFRLVRRATRDPREITWDPAAGVLDPKSLEGIDAVIHLAGESVGEGRWTETRKALIRDSRVLGTRTLVDAIKRMERPPKVLVSASAVGFYGTSEDSTFDESSPAGKDFLASICEAWEGEACAAEASGVRVVTPRLGVILDPRGGALQKLIKPFKAGLGGRIGSGRQWMSWVAMDDVVYAIDHAIQTDLRGPYNVVAPNPVTQAEFARTLARTLSRPSIFPLPAFAVRALFGEMGDSVLLSGQRTLPRVLETSGYKFALPVLEPALRHLLGRATL